MKNLKFKLLKGSAILATSAAVIAAASLPLVQATSGNSVTMTRNTTNAATYKYEPVTIASGYNCNTIISSSDSSTTTISPIGWRGVNGIDDPNIRRNQDEIEAGNYNNASLYLDSVRTSGSHHGLPAPQNGFTHISSEDTTKTPGLEWKIPVSKTTSVNNTMKLFGVGKATAKGTFTFSDFGVFNKLYILCIMSNTKTTQKATFKATINYTDGSSNDNQYEVYDWFPNSDNLTKLKTNGWFANDNYSRMWFYGDKGKTPTEKWDDGSEQGKVVFNQCPITVQTDKIVKSLDIELISTEEDTGTLDVFAVSGETAGDVLAPISIKTHVLGNKKGKVTWQDADATSAANTAYYYLDVYHFDEQNNRIWDVESLELNATKYKTDKSYIIEKELTEGIKYHVRMRAGNAARVQSANSNTDYIIIDSAIANEVYTYVLEGQTEKTTFKIPVNQAVTVYTRVRQKDTQTKCKDQNIQKWNIPEAFKDKITITQKQSSNDEADTSWEFLSTVPITSTEISAESHADPDAESKPITPVVSINAPTWGTITTTAKTAKLVWNKPNIGDTVEANNTYTITVKDADGKVITTKDNVTYSTTSLDLTGLTPLTTYTATIKMSCVYDSTTYTSDETTTTFTTAENVGSTITATEKLTFLYKGDETPTQTATTTILSEKEGNATSQDITWEQTKGSNGKIEATHTTFTAETSTTWTITAKKPGSVDVVLTATKYPTVTETVNVTINTAPTTATAGSNLTPNSFVANWNAASWADRYEVSLYKGEAPTPFKSVDVESSKTSYKFEDLDYNQKYYYTVKVACKDVNNQNVCSTETTKVAVTTPISYPTAVTATKNGTEISEYKTIRGSAVTLNSSVVGTKFEGTVFDAYDKKVKTNVYTETQLKVEEQPAGSDTHSYTVTGQLVHGNWTVFDLIAVAKDKDGNEVSKTIKVYDTPMNAISFENVSTTTFTVKWTPLDASLIQTSDNVQYVVEYTTDPNFATYDTVTTTNSSVTVSGVAPNQTFYVRAKYTNNGYSSEYTEVQSVVTQAGITAFGLDKNSMTIIGTGDNDTDTITATLVSSTADHPIDWQIEDESIATLETKPSNDMTTISTKVVRPHKVGTTYIKAWPQGEPRFVQTCKLQIVKGILDPLVLNVKDITTDSFTLYWNPITDWNGGKVKYKVSVWSENEDGHKLYQLKDYVVEGTQTKVSKKNTNIVNGADYYCTVHAFNDHFETNEANVVKVRLLDPGLPLWAIILISTGSAVAGLLLLALGLYHLWKNSILKTYDIDNIKYTKSGKPRTNDKLFRKMDKVIVAMNRKNFKHSNTLYTRFGTKEEQKRNLNFK